MRARLLIGALAAAAIVVAACGDDDECPDKRGTGNELVVITHDSFDATEEVIAAFEQEHGVTVTLVKGGDANQLVNRAILSARNPEADVLFGVDNLAYKRADEADVFCSYAADRRSEIPQSVRDQFGDSETVTPIDFGYVNINADRAWGAPPSSFEDLTSEPWRGKLVVEDPATSSPGLQFLASTVAYFGEGGWQDFWRGLKDNDVLVTDGWEDAYYTQFSRWGGERPLVVSYTTSPAAEVFFADPPVDEPPTLNVIPGPLFRQVEAAGVLRRADHPGLAREFIDFMLSNEFQGQIPQTMFVYPVIPGIETPEWWQWAEVDVEPASLEADQAEIDRWVREWTEIMRR
ncbi:MAG: thiamine ABC transporter substrate-binding protein [Dehalococcoidia bacterium]|jgi:thiamine transport system substrate-binding protein|nr:thiamine ABC transporter substrate-binding protein [Dehalococcoidia bacterium]